MSVEIKSTHQYGYRYGKWAVVTGLVWVKGRACYRVRFYDGVEDTWPIHDPQDPYEFRHTTPEVIEATRQVLALLEVGRKGDPEHLFCDEDAGGNHIFDGDWWRSEVMRAEVALLNALEQEAADVR